MNSIKGEATSESIISNARYAVGDGNGSEGGATKESIISNARDAIRDNCILTTCNKRISSRFNNRITILATIVGSITTFD